MLVPLLCSSILLFLLPTITYSQNGLIPTDSSNTSQFDPSLTYCSGDTNFTTPGIYKTNLDDLLTELTTYTTYFFNATSGSVYGLAQCVPDASIPDCSNCLNRASAAALVGCPNRTAATLRYDNCILRYSDQRFFSHVEDGLHVIYWNIQNATDPTAFDRLRTDLMGNVSSDAAAAATRFAVGIANYSEFGKIYAMAHCTRDLTPDDCYGCLDRAVSYFSSGKMGGRVYAVSCAIRFETYSYFSQSEVPPPPATAVLGPPLPTKSVSPATGGGGGGDKDKGKTSNTRKIVIIVVPVVVCSMLLLAICIYFSRIKRVPCIPDEHDIRSTSESLLFDLGTLRAATNNFSDANKLGEGGFGPVYKGSLQDGQEIAVKKLSMIPLQGLVELRNAVVLVAKLQHINLVRLFGFCLEEQERLLVYEYLPNKSLDEFLFDPSGRQQLHWGRRFKIIEGIGRGLLYLHQHSQLMIIHRDLKASNILLDRDMNPKISNFGLAKLFGVDETQGIAGAPRYMAPDYAMHGKFTTKSDIFSYGVLLLEIVTGQKNSDFQGSEQIDLLSHVWQHWTEGKASEVKDPSLGDLCKVQEILKCIHIGLLCVQEDSSKRPCMESVNLMLSNYSITLPAPSAPAFYIRASTRSESDLVDQTSDFFARSADFSANDITISEREPR